jgi:hypothetical protein
MALGYFWQLTTLSRCTRESAPLTSRRGNPEAAEAAAAPPQYYRCPNHSLRLFYFLAQTPDSRYCRYITHAAYPPIAYSHPSRSRAPLGRVNTLHTTRRDSHRHTLAFDAHTQPLEAAL